MITTLVLVLLAALLCALWWQNDTIGRCNDRIGRLEADLAMARIGHPHPAPVVVLRHKPAKPLVRATSPRYVPTPAPGTITTAELRLWDTAVEGLPAFRACDGRPVEPESLPLIRPRLRAVS